MGELVEGGFAESALGDSKLRWFGEKVSVNGSRIMDEAIVVVDQERRLLAFNRVASELFGLSPKLRGHLVINVVRIPEFVEAVDAASRGESRIIEWKLDSGAPRNLMVSGTPQGATVVIHVTELRGLETVHPDFVANVSYELRAPVSLIRANTETLLAGALEQPIHARHFLDAIRRNAEWLGQLISDLLDISRIEAGMYPIDRRVISLVSVMRAVNKAVSHACRRRSVMLELDIGADVLVWADAGRLEQALTYLVENAVAYGPKGSRVGIAAVDQGSMVRIDIRDEGPRIAPAHRPHVFECFYRVPGRSRSVRSTGLSLAIVKHLAEAMGGVVGVDVRDSTGSVFWLQLSRA